MSSYSCDNPRTAALLEQSIGGGAQQARNDQALRRGRPGKSEQEVADPWNQPIQIYKDCHSFDKECTGCRGYLSSCCSNKNCADGRVCKAGMSSYSCDNPRTAALLEQSIGGGAQQARNDQALRRGRPGKSEQEVADPWNQPIQIYKDCHSFDKECTGCR